MKWCRFSVRDSEVKYGIVTGAEVVEVEGSPFIGFQKTANVYQLPDIRLSIPVIPSNFYAIGVNYASHVEWANKRFKLSFALPKQPDLGYRSPNALIPTDAPVIVPDDSEGPLQYEGELVAVIGRSAKGVSEADALSYVLGYTLGNDLSERSWQFSDRTLWRAKNADTFKPMGPWIETDVDPDNAVISTRINGRTVSEYNTKNALFSLAAYISRASRYVTLHPGDVVWMGSDGACEPDLAIGDIVEIEQEKIGILRNPITRVASKT